MDIYTIGLAGVSAYHISEAFGASTFLVDGKTRLVIFYQAHLDDLMRLDLIQKQTNMSNNTTLYYYADERIKISIEAYFTENGDLMIDGYDIGKTVEEAMGDSDYEYQATIKKAKLDKLCSVLGLAPNDTQAILPALAARFNDNYCFSNILELLKTNDIEHSTFFWR